MYTVCIPDAGWDLLCFFKVDGRVRDGFLSPLFERPSQGHPNEGRPWFLCIGGARLCGYAIFLSINGVFRLVVASCCVMLYVIRRGTPCVVCDCVRRKRGGVRKQESEMKNAMCMLAVAGLVGTAGAQDFSLSIAGAPATVDATSAVTITIDIVGNASVGTHMLGGSFALVTGGHNATVIDMTWIPASWSAFNTDGGFDGNGNYNPVIFGQLVIPGVPPFDVPAAGSELGNSIGSFQVVISAVSGFFSLDFHLVAQDPFSLEVLDLATGETFQSSAGNLSLNGASITVIPSPSSLALIGLGGLAASRRRR